MQRGDDEIDLLEVVDAIKRAHHPFQIEPKAVRRIGGEREDRFRSRGHNASAIDPQALRRFQQPELDRVPIEPCEIGKAAERECAQPAFPIGLHVIGKDRIGQHRHMAENIVKYVRLLQIIEFVRAADEITGRKPPVGEMFEEYRIGHEARHRHDPPPCESQELFIQLAEIRNAMAVQKSVAGAPRQYVRLPLIERRPRPMLGLAIALKPLGDRPIGVCAFGKIRLPMIRSLKNSHRLYPYAGSLLGMAAKG